MSNPYFQFKQFTVWHDQCAMKVGTDGVLLGAWSDVTYAKHILDIGTGTGLIALMMAQRSQACILGLEIDEDAASQAISNVNQSPWKDRIKIMEIDFRKYETEHKFDLIVSNPPYFVDSLKCPDGQRNKARHTDELNYTELIKHASALLSKDGMFSLIIPMEALDSVIEIAELYTLHPSKITKVHTKLDIEPKRALITFSFHLSVCMYDDLVIELSRHVYSKKYIELTKEYYLNM